MSCDFKSQIVWPVIQTQETPLPPKKLPWSKEEARAIAKAIANGHVGKPAGKIVAELKLR